MRLSFVLAEPQAIQPRLDALEKEVRQARRTTQRRAVQRGLVLERLGAWPTDPVLTLLMQGSPCPSSPGG